MRKQKGTLCLTNNKKIKNKGQPDFLFVNKKLK